MIRIPQDSIMWLWSQYNFILDNFDQFVFKKTVSFFIRDNVEQLSWEK